ncbi:hypothetical protein AX17_000596 [Amanita inopinata Kibby_2008]|nr:hypothetical protein AX17_000596 [Amanita inopinata Kibby_2008]
MLRLTRPLYHALKQSTGITGLPVHPNPLPELTKSYENTLSLLNSIPPTSVYRQGVEALTRHKLDIVHKANGDISTVEVELNEGQIEQALDIAADEYRLAAKMIEWKAWEPLEEKPDPGQWEYFGQSGSS